MRTGGDCRTVGREISRFPRKERLHMPGALTTPGRPDARAVAPGCVAFRHLHSVGTQNETLSRLNGWPMHSPVNASPWPSRTTAHDSGPMWIATPSSQGTCTLYSLPVSRRFAYLVGLSSGSGPASDIRRRPRGAALRLHQMAPILRQVASFGERSWLIGPGQRRKIKALAF